MKYWCLRHDAIVSSVDRNCMLNLTVGYCQAYRSTGWASAFETLGKWTNIREENPNVNVKICVILLHSDDRRLCEVLALSYAQKLENKEAIMRREADTKESRLAQKRQEKAEKKLQRKRDELQKEKEKR